MQGCAYVDGEFVAPEDAKISIFDWGFLHSDATYDVAHVWQGRFFRLGDHLDRFFASLRRLRLDPGKSREEVRAIAHECVRRSGLRDAYVEVLCTRVDILPTAEAGGFLLRRCGVSEAHATALASEGS